MEAKPDGGVVAVKNVSIDFWSIMQGGCGLAWWYSLWVTFTNATPPHTCHTHTPHLHTHATPPHTCHTSLHTTGAAIGKSGILQDWESSQS